MVTLPPQKVIPTPERSEVEESRDEALKVTHRDPSTWLGMTRRGDAWESGNVNLLIVAEPRFGNRAFPETLFHSLLGKQVDVLTLRESRNGVSEADTFANGVWERAQRKEKAPVIGTGAKRSGGIPR